MPGGSGGKSVKAQRVKREAMRPGTPPQTGAKTGLACISTALSFEQPFKLLQRYCNEKALKTGFISDITYYMEVQNSRVLL